MSVNHHNERASAPRADQHKKSEPQAVPGRGDERTPEKTIGQIAYAERAKQLDEDKPGRESGNELSGGTDPTRKKTGEF
jgi:hypothetical protein